MQVFHSNDTFPEDSCAACIGFFDGVHKGHRFLLDNLKRIAAERGLKSAVVTFRTHPREVIEPDFNIRLLSSFREKLDRLASQGIDYCFVLDFNEDVRSLTSSEFMADVLLGKFKTKSLLIGYDHRFGSDRGKGFDDYKSFGDEIGIEVINSDCYAPEGMNISSSSVRRALMKGDIRSANAMLGSVYNIRGMVESGNRIGNTIGFPTANIVPGCCSKIIPHKGVYAAIVTYNDRRYPAMLNIGNRPTITSDGIKTIEVNLIGFEGDLYGKELNVEFIDFIRAEQKFDSLDNLKRQLYLDRETALDILKKEGYDF